jgi:hypothetical protein
VAYYAVPSSESALIQRNSAESLSVTFYSGETATDADGSVTIGIVDAEGSTVVASGTATTSAGSGVYTYTLAAQSDLNELTATYSGTFGGNAMEFTTQHEIVGGFYSSPSEIRAMDSISGESSTFPTADIVKAIAWSMDVIDDYVGASFVYRFHRDVLDGTNTSDIQLSHMFPQVIISGSIDGTALTATQISNLNKYKSGVIRLKDDSWTYANPGGQIKINYEAGVSKTPPSDIAWAARTLARYHLLEQVSRIPDRAISVQSEFGNIQLAQPGMNKPTPIPDVNVILNRHRHRAPVAF